MIHVPTAPWAHLVFDLSAWSAGLGAAVVLHRWRLKASTDQLATRVDGGYFLALACGAIPGAWLVGSFNSLREHGGALSHSVAGALVGAIVGVELYKAARGIRGSTGGAFVGSFVLGLVIGRWGCFFAGLADDTYGLPTRVTWAVDLGDGIGRHPVQVYESATMALFLAVYLEGLWRRRPWALQRGFYAMCIWYGTQRFCWEFLKPYPQLIGPFNVFHVLCLGLAIYGWVYYVADRRRQQPAQGRPLPFSGTDHEPV